jgi:hypothetical protein
VTETNVRSPSIMSMIIQVITGSSEYDKPTEILIQQVLSAKGHKVNLVPIDKFIRTGNSEFLYQTITSRANITIVLSGIRWSNLSTRIPTRLLPNTIVVTSNPALQFAWEIRPAAIITWDKLLKKKIRLAINALVQLPVSFPARSVTYQRAEFGWIGRSIMEEPFAAKAWDALHEHVWSGHQFSTWSVHKGYLTGSFEIVNIAEDSVTVRSPTAKNLQIVPKRDFFQIAIDWKEYKSGKIPRHELRDRTRYSTYIIGLLHWLDIEGPLE